MEGESEGNGEGDEQRVKSKNPFCRSVYGIKMKRWNNSIDRMFIVSYQHADLWLWQNEKNEPLLLPWYNNFVLFSLHCAVAPFQFSLFCEFILL